MANVESVRPDDEQGRKRKRRNIGTFPCSKCSKVFTRSDHLARHYLNHQPKEVYVCDYIIKNHNGERRACGKTFVRKDLRERHLKRHLMLQDCVKPEDGDETKFPVSTDISPVAISDAKPLILPPMNRGSVGSVQSLHTPGPGSLQEIRPPQMTPMPGQGPLRAHSTAISGSLSDLVLASPLVLPLVSSLGPLQGPQRLSLPHQPLAPPAGQTQSFAGQYNSIYPGNLNGAVRRNSYIAEAQVTGSNPGLGQNIPMNQNLGNNMSPAPGMTPIPNQNIVFGHNQGHNQQMAQFVGPPSTYKHENNQAQMAQKYAMNTNDMNRNNGFPQSQNDILSWLFMDSPDMPRMGGKSALASHASSHSLSSDTRLNNFNQQQLSPSTHRLLSTDRSIYEDDGSLLMPFYHNPPELNVGLQDLNFFLNNSNPLDEMFFKPNGEQHNHLIGENSFPSGINIHPSTVSSSSPSNTNESLTPGDLSPLSSHQEPIEKRLETHSRANKPHNRQFFVDSHILQRILDALPNLTRENLLQIFPTDNDRFNLEDRISFYLYGYWEAFHTRFSILHKPSFDTSICEPLLLLSMLLIGCMYCADSLVDSENHRMCPEYKFSLLVAVPLRFTLFQHEDFKSPVKVWILQSLNLLEWCEKNYLLRAMHERAHIHHGTTVQLLRRSPFLGGNPTVANKAVNSASDTGTSGGEEDQSDGGASDIEETSSKDRVLFRKWVDSESMKRITFMTFYLDVIDYIKFRHNPQIPFFQLQLLNLPCDEQSLWNADDMDGSFKKLVKRQKKLQKTNNQGMRKLKEQNRIRPGMNFLSALKKIMKAQRVGVDNQKLPMFTKSILFGGLVSIMHQMQQTELQNNFTLIMAAERSEKQKNLVWKEILTRVFDTWEAEMHAKPLNLTNDPFFGIRKGQCKFPMYHLAQIVGISDINHYDIAIFGGSPGNMSVDATSKDMKIVQRKLTSLWVRNSKINTVNRLVNFKSVIHCYWLLWSLMLAPLGDDKKPVSTPITYGWRVDHDYYDAMYAVSIATLVLWCYTYSSIGIESSTFKDLENTMPLDEQRNYCNIRNLAQEDAYQYLFRIRQEFSQLLENEGLLEDYILHTAGPRNSHVPLYNVIVKYCELLPSITNKQNISGLCFLVGTNLLKSQWQVIRENAKLIINCGLRSVGKRSVHCPDLFDNTFTE